MSPIISFVIPTYNAGNYIEGFFDAAKEVLDSEDIELLFVDDGSTDDTQEKLKKHGSRPNVRILSKRHSGLSNTRNFGISMAIGKSICFLDVDDVFEFGYLPKIITILKENDCDVLFLNHDSFSEGKENERFISYDNSFYDISNCSGCEFVIHTGTIPCACWNMFIKREMITKINEFVDVFGEDIDFNTKLFYFAQNVCTLNIISYHYILRNTSLANGLSNEKLLSVFDDFIDLKDDIFTFVHDNNISGQYLEVILNSIVANPTKWYLIKCYDNNKLSKAFLHSSKNKLIHNFQRRPALSNRVWYILIQFEQYWLIKVLLNFKSMYINNKHIIKDK